ARINAPHIDYRESIMDGLHLDLNATSDQLDFEMGWTTLSSGPVNIERTTFTGALENKVLQLNFDAYDKDTTLVHIASEIKMVPDTLNVHLIPTGLTFNKKSWDIPATNQILIAKKFMDFKDFVLGRNQQKMTLSNAIPDRSKEHLGIRFENLSLATFTSLLNPDETLASGILEGNLIMEDPFADTGIVAEMNIDKLSVMGSTL